MEEYIARMVEKTTNEWLDVMERPENQSGVVWRMAASGELPEGVDPENANVKRLCEQARSESCFSKFQLQVD